MRDYGRPPPQNYDRPPPRHLGPPQVRDDYRNGPPQPAPSHYGPPRDSYPPPSRPRDFDRRPSPPPTHQYYDRQPPPPVQGDSRRMPIRYEHYGPQGHEHGPLPPPEFGRDRAPQRQAFGRDGRGPPSQGFGRDDRGPSSQAFRDDRGPPTQSFGRDRGPPPAEFGRDDRRPQAPPVAYNNRDDVRDFHDGPPVHTMAPQMMTAGGVDSGRYESHAMHPERTRIDNNRPQPMREGPPSMPFETNRPPISGKRSLSTSGAGPSVFDRIQNIISSSNNSSGRSSRNHDDVDVAHPNDAKRIRVAEEYSRPPVDKSYGQSLGGDRSFPPREYDAPPPSRRNVPPPARRHPVYSKDSVSFNEYRRPEEAPTRQELPVPSQEPHVLADLAIHPSRRRKIQGAEVAAEPPRAEPSSSRPVLADVAIHPSRLQKIQGLSPQIPKSAPIESASTAESGQVLADTAIHPSRLRKILLHDMASKSHNSSSNSLENGQVLEPSFRGSAPAGAMHGGARDFGYRGNEAREPAGRDGRYRPSDSRGGGGDELSGGRSRQRENRSRGGDDRPDQRSSSRGRGGSSRGRGNGGRGGRPDRSSARGGRSQYGRFEGGTSNDYPRTESGEGARGERFASNSYPTATPAASSHPSLADSGSFEPVLADLAVHPSRRKKINA